MCLYWKVYCTHHGCNGQITITWSFMNTILLPPPPPPPPPQGSDKLRGHTLAKQPHKKKHSLQLRYGPHTGYTAPPPPPPHLLKEVINYAATLATQPHKKAQFTAPVWATQLSRKACTVLYGHRTSQERRTMKHSNTATTA